MNAVRPAGPAADRQAATAQPRQRPAWSDLFREAVYSDGPYDQGDEDDLKDTEG
jgi:hypothetical protein